MGAAMVSNASSAVSTETWTIKNNSSKAIQFTPTLFPKALGVTSTWDGINIPDSNIDEARTLKASSQNKLKSSEDNNQGEAIISGATLVLQFKASNVCYSYTGNVGYTEYSKTNTLTFADQNNNYVSIDFNGIKMKWTSSKTSTPKHDGTCSY